MMKKFLSVALVACGLLSMSACKTAMHVSEVNGWMIPVDSTWDAKPNEEAVAVIRPYKQALDSVMGKKLGVSAMTMANSRPEDLLQNLVADILREAAVPTLGHEADMGLINIGGLRNVLPEGDVTLGNVFEILPFENALCIMTLDGATLRELLAAIAARGGEGVSGVNIVMSKERKLLDCSVAGRPIDDNKLYTLATIDYLAEGNDGMAPLTKAKSEVYPENGVIRDVFINYLMRKNASGEALTSKIEGRIVVK
jgi:2',3'-cyclic-nucleotide 2'-phosphodiesterase (5'-nucleotidase family)